MGPLRRLLRSQLRINIASGFATTGLSAALALLSYPVFLHFLGLEQYGVWLILATVLSVAQLGNFGLAPAVSKLIAEDHGRGDTAGVYRYISAATLTLLIMGSVAFAILLAFRAPLVAALSLSPANAHTVYTLFPWIGPLSLYVVTVDTLAVALAGLGRIDLANYAQIGAQCVAFVIATLLLNLGYGIPSLMIGSAVSYVVLHLATITLIRRTAGPRPTAAALLAFDRARFSRLLHFGSWVFAGSIANLLLNPFNRAMLTRYVGVSSVTIFDIAFNSSMKIRGLVETGLRALAPEVSRNPERLASVSRKTSRLIAMAALPAYAAIFFLAPQLLLIWLGSRFVPELTLAFRILLAGSFASLWGASAYHLLMGLGQARQVLICFAIQSGVSAGIILVAPVTLRAVVLATSCGMLASTIYLRHQLARASSDAKRRSRDIPAVGTQPSQETPDAAPESLPD